MTNHVPEATKPASGDYAWLGAEAGSVADLMYMLNTEDWYDAINSRFVSELLDDTLPESILKAYLIQDFKFYNNGMMARLIKLAPRQETKDMLAAQSQWFADNEATYFEHFLEAYHVSQEEYDATEPTPANKEYGAYLDSLSDKSWPELITAICCMEWLYLAWAKRTVDADVIQQVPAHKGWSTCMKARTSASGRRPHLPGQRILLHRWSGSRSVPHHRASGAPLLRRLLPAGVSLRSTTA